jgi:hypothetical protein
MEGAGYRKWKCQAQIVAVPVVALVTSPRAKDNLHSSSGPGTWGATSNHMIPCCRVALFLGSWLFLFIPSHFLLGSVKFPEH